MIREKCRDIGRQYLYTVMASTHIEVTHVLTVVLATYEAIGLQQSLLKNEMQ